MPTPRETPSWDVTGFANTDRTEWVWRGAESHADTVFMGFDRAAPGTDLTATQVAALQTDERYGIRTVNWREIHSTYNAPTPDPELESSAIVRNLQAAIDRSERDLRDMVYGWQSRGDGSVVRVARARGPQIFHDVEPEDL